MFLKQIFFTFFAVITQLKRLKDFKRLHEIRGEKYHKFQIQNGKKTKLK